MEQTNREQTKLITGLLSVLTGLIAALIGLVVYIWVDNKTTNNAAHMKIEAKLDEFSKTNETVLINTYKIVIIMDKNVQQDLRLDILENKPN